MRHMATYQVDLPETIGGAAATWLLDGLTVGG